jgi:hypothetical protein
MSIDLLMEHLQDPRNVLLTAVAFQYLFFAVFLFSQRKARFISNNLFAAFMLFNGWVLLGLFLISFESILMQFTYPILISENSIYFLIPPMFFLYVVSLTRKDFEFKAIHLVHIIPFVIDFIHLTVRYFTNSSFFINNLIFYQYFFGAGEQLIRNIILNVQFFGYLIASLYVIEMYRIRVGKIFSSIKKIGLSWLKVVIICMMVIRVLNIINSYILAQTGFPGSFLAFSLLIGQYILAIIVIYKGPRQPAVFPEAAENSE